MEVIEIRQKKIISIHAPTRGATDEIIRNQFIEDISIHAPTRGATLKRKSIIIYIKFQSTLLQEERRQDPQAHVVYTNFNPRSYKRSDSKNAQYSLCISAIIIA